MSSVNYSLRNKGVRLIDSSEAWIKGKNGKIRLNPNYTYVGKLSMDMSNMLLSVSDKKKPTYRGDVCDLNTVAKNQIINHFFDDRGNRNKKKVAYLVIPKKNKDK